MARKKVKVAEEVAPDLGTYYQNLQLTPEEKAKAREQAEKARTQRSGEELYSKFLEVAGKEPYHWEFFKQMREDED